MASVSDLILYHYDWCPFCVRVRRVVERLGISLEERNIITHREYRQELAQARGRATVPVLRIRNEGGEDEWMPESRDIIRYLEQRFG